MHGTSGPDESGWRRAARCGTGACVEVAHDGDSVMIRDSKAPDVPPQRYTREEFAAFLAAVKSGEFDDLT